MSEIASPCAGRCCLDVDNVCVGCYRSMSEITEWSQATESTKKMIIDTAELRRKKLSNSTDN
ncbi:DUF1289 domain-containing protein [Psychromonas arctica]|uniref:DUF1289 domain-containing protein n=1 Tax=Psychromonas arctica TaxID=168275 RepID=UPI002FD3CB13